MQTSALFAYIVARLKEPGTWQGLIMIAGAGTAWAQPEMLTQIVALSVLLAGAVKAALPD